MPGYYQPTRPVAGAPKLKPPQPDRTLLLLGCTAFSALSPALPLLAACSCSNNSARKESGAPDPGRREHNRRLTLLRSTAGGPEVLRCAETPLPGAGSRFPTAHPKNKQPLNLR